MKNIISLAAACLFAIAVPAAAAPVSGAIYTTNIGCVGVNKNIYGSKADVYVNGGPANENAKSGLPDGSYYIRVTQPAGGASQLVELGTSVGSPNPTPVVVSGGKFNACYQLQDIVYKSLLPLEKGYADTGNNGGEYKVWISSLATFDNDATKTDNFKVKVEQLTVPSSGMLTVEKFYDANANTRKDSGEAIITGWNVAVADHLLGDAHPDVDYNKQTTWTSEVDAGEYHAFEANPVQTNWMATTGTQLSVTVPAGGQATASFGNLCLGAGGGLTLGFWSNKNGQALILADDLAMLTALNLRQADGANFDPANNASFRNWILSASATNMSYMLSAQLAAMRLNVFNGKVNGSALIYAPGTDSGSTSGLFAGFATVAAVMNEANAILATNGSILSDNSLRPRAEAVKNALDRGNNNLNFVQATPCLFSF